MYKKNACMHGLVRFISGPGQVRKIFRNLLFCNPIGQLKNVMVELKNIIWWHEKNKRNPSGLPDKNVIVLTR